MVGSSVNPLVAETRGSKGIGNRWLVQNRDVRFYKCQLIGQGNLIPFQQKRISYS